MKKLLFAFGLMLAASVAFSQTPNVYKIVKTDTCGYNCIVFKMTNMMPHDGIKTMKGFLYVDEETNGVYRYNEAMKKYGRFDTATYCPAGSMLVLKGNNLIGAKYAFKVKQW